MGISFNRKRLYGVEIYDSLDSDKFSIVHLDNGYNIRIRDDNQNWVYPIWRDKSFKNLEDAQLWLNLHNLKTATPSHIEYDDTVFASIALTALSDRLTILAAVNTKNLAQNLSRVRSSNVWAYGLNLKDRKDKTGDLLVQFKAKGGGAGDVYIYYDVPTAVYRRWQSAPSVGHYFWVYIRNNYKYSKLTGDKRGKLRNAINQRGLPNENI